MIPLTYYINGSSSQFGFGFFKFAFCFLSLSLPLHFMICALKKSKLWLSDPGNGGSVQKGQTCYSASRKTKFYLPETEGEGEDWTDDRMMLSRIFKKSCWKIRKRHASEGWFQPLQVLYLGCQGKGEEGMESLTGMVVIRFMCQLRLVKESWSFSAVWIASWRHGCTWSSEQAVCMCAWELLD